MGYDNGDDGEVDLDGDREGLEGADALEECADAYAPRLSDPDFPGGVSGAFITAAIRGGQVDADGPAEALVEQAMVFGLEIGMQLL